MRSFKHIAKLVKNSRLKHPNNYSQATLSEKLGYKNGQFLSNVERGLCNIPYKMLNTFSEVLNIPPDEVKEAIMKDYEETLTKHFK